MVLSYFLMNHKCINSLYLAEVRVLIVAVINLEALLTGKHSHSYWNAYVGILLLNPPRLTCSSPDTPITLSTPKHSCICAWVTITVISYVFHRT